MNSQNNNSPKHLKILLTMMFIFTALLFAHPLTTYADTKADTSLDHNAGGGGSASTSGTSAAGGVSLNQHGYRFYVVDHRGQVVSKVVDLLPEAYYNKEGEFTPTFTYSYGTTRIGNAQMTKDHIKPSDMPAPLIWQGNNIVGNGLTLRQWLLADNENGNQNLTLLMRECLGEETTSLFSNNSSHYFAVLEPILWHGIFTGKEPNTNTGKSFYGTFYNWLQFYAINNWGYNFTTIVDQGVLGTCMQLVRDEPNLKLKVPGGFIPFATPWLSLDTIKSEDGHSFGWGIHLYYNREVIENQTTCDEDAGDTPHKAPKESHGEVTIVKNYIYSEDNGVTFKDGGCYVTENTGKNILQT